MGALEDHDREATLFGFIFWLRANSGCERGVFETRLLWEKGGEQMRRVDFGYVAVHGVKRV